MNVLLVNRTALRGQKGGMARAIESLGEALAREIRVVSFVPGPSSQHRLVCTQGPLGPEYRLAVPLPFGEGRAPTRYAAWAVRFPRALLQARSLMERERIDLVHTTFHSDNILFWLLNRWIGLPYVVTLHGSDAVYFDRVPWGHRSLARRVVTGAAAVISVSAGVATAARRWFGDVPLYTIHNGVDPEAIADEASRAVLPPEVPSRFVLALGALVRVKGIDILVRAWAALAPRFPDVQLVVAGAGPERAGLDDLAQELGIADRVVWLGWVDHETAMGLLSRALAYVMPSRSEGLGYGVLEAGANRTPVVATAVGGIPEVVEGDRFGALVPAEDPGRLAGALGDLLAAPAAAAARGRALYARVEERFSMAQMTRAHLRLYRRLLERGPAVARPDGREAPSAGQGE